MRKREVLPLFRTVESGKLIQQMEKKVDGEERIVSGYSVGVRERCFIKTEDAWDVIFMSFRRGNTYCNPCMGLSQSGCYGFSFPALRRKSPCQDLMQSKSSVMCTSPGNCLFLPKRTATKNTQFYIPFTGNVEDRSAKHQHNFQYFRLDTQPTMSRPVVGAKPKWDALSVCVQCRLDRISSIEEMYESIHVYFIKCW